MDLVRILIADDHELVRQGLIGVLHRSHPEWEIVGEAADGRQAIKLGEELRPNFAILDLAMPEFNGLEVTERLVNALPGIRILILTVHSAEPVMRQIRQAGANGFLAKNEVPQRLVEAMEKMVGGTSFFASDSAFRPASRLNGPERVPVQFLLTPRELEVLRQLASGLSNKQVATVLNMSTRTVETHRANIMVRLSVGSLGGMVKLAIHDKLV